MKFLLGAALLFLLAPAAGAESFHWADRDGFHAVDQVTKVPLEHRRDLPMARNRTSLPFTAEEDRDGAMFVWFILGQGGAEYPYTAAAEFPKSPHFMRVATPRAGDIAWWPGLVAIYGDTEGAILTAKGKEPLREIEKSRGRASWYRFSAPPSTAKVPAARRAPGAQLKAADRALAGLDAASTSPPRIRDDAERDRLRQGWRRAVADLEALRTRYPDDPRVLWRLGECYRLGHNLDVPGSWERTEAYLLRAEELAPESPEPYISLGAHYADTHSDYGARAESQFRRALEHARKEQLPQLWWGLAVALYYQGKTVEALAYVDRLIARNPRDLSARKLRQTIVESGKK